MPEKNNGPEGWGLWDMAPVVAEAWLMICCGCLLLRLGLEGAATPRALQRAGGRRAEGTSRCKTVAQGSRRNPVHACPAGLIMVAVECGGACIFSIVMELKFTTVQRCAWSHIAKHTPLVRHCQSCARPVEGIVAL